MLILTEWEKDFKWHIPQLPAKDKKGELDIINIPFRLSGFFRWVFGILKIIRVLKKYDIIVFRAITKTSVVLCFLERLKLIKLPFAVIAELNLYEHDKSLRSAIRYKLFKLLYKNIGLFFPFSKAHCDYLHRLTGISREKYFPVFQAVDYLPVSKYPDASGSKTGDYLLIPGRTGRDMKLLSKILKNYKKKAILVTNKKSVKKISFQKNIKILYDIPLKDLLNLMKKAKYILIPLKDTENPVGFRILFYALQLKKAVIMTKTKHAAEYFPRNPPLVFVSPGDIKAVEDEMKKLENHPQTIEPLAKKAAFMLKNNFTSEYYIKTMYKMTLQKYINFK